MPYLVQEFVEHSHGAAAPGEGERTTELVYDAHGLPLGVTIAAANVPETELIEPALDAVVIEEGEPEHLLYDKAGDSDPLRERLADRGVELVTPHRKNRRRAPLQDGRALRRYKRRFKVEHLIQRLKVFRRLRVRYEYLPEMFAGFVQLACLLILLHEFA